MKTSHVKNLKSRRHLNNQCSKTKFTPEKNLDEHKCDFLILTVFSYRVMICKDTHDQIDVIEAWKRQRLQSLTFFFTNFNYLSGFPTITRNTKHADSCS